MQLLDLLIIAAKFASIHLKEEHIGEKCKFLEIRKTGNKDEIVITGMPFDQG